MSAYRFTPLTWVLLLASLAALAVATMAWQRRQVPGARGLLWMECAIAVWALGAAMDSAAVGASLRLLWSKVEYIGLALSPLAFFAFALQFTRREHWLTRPRFLILAAVPLLTVGMAWTNDWHGLLWPAVTYDPVAHVAYYAHGPWFWIFVAATYTLLLWGMGLMGAALLDAGARYRRQTSLLFIIALLPMIVNLAYIFEVSPFYPADITPIAFLISGLLLTWGIVRFQILELAPVARRQLMDLMREPVLVLDSRDQIIDANRAMDQLLAGGSGAPTGQPADLALAHWPELRAELARARPGVREVHLSRGEEHAYFNLTEAPFQDTGGQIRGRMIVLSDISQRVKLEQEREALIAELRSALEQVQTLQGLLPICANCKKIRDDSGYWHSLEEYLYEHADVEFTHGICPECVAELYGDHSRRDSEQDQNESARGD